MEQFEKVVQGLDCFVNGTVGPLMDDCKIAGCKYFGHGDCEAEIMADALAMIRQQQERIKELEAAIAEWEKFAPFLYAHGMLHEPPKEDGQCTF